MNANQEQLRRHLREALTDHQISSIDLPSCLGYMKNVRSTGVIQRGQVELDRLVDVIMGVIPTVSDDEVLRLLNELRKDETDVESNHSIADAALLKFIRLLGYPQVADAFTKLERYYG